MPEVNAGWSRKTLTTVNIAGKRETGRLDVFRIKNNKRVCRSVTSLLCASTLHWLRPARPFHPAPARFSSISGLTKDGNNTTQVPMSRQVSAKFRRGEE